MHYVVRFEMDEAGWWFVSVPDVRGCHTQARTIAQGLERIREALALFVGDQKADRSELEVDVKLPGAAARAIRDLGGARKQLELLQERASKLSRDAVSRLVIEAGLSVRDAARLLDLSHQRVHQLAKAQPARRRERSRRATTPRRVASQTASRRASRRRTTSTD